MSKFLKFLLIYYFALNVVSSDDTIELACTSDADCSSFEDKPIGSDCRDGKCSCWIRRQSEKDEQIMPCTPRSSIKILGASSSSTCPQCTNPHMECVDGVCKCQGGFRWLKASDNDRCVPMSVMLGKSCEMDEQCKENEKLSECVDKVCRCTKRFSEVNNVCRSMVTRGKNICKEASDCSENEECLSNKCVCKKDFVASEIKDQEKCIPFAHFGDNCTESLQCEMGLGVGSICEKGQCVCNYNHTKYDYKGVNMCRKLIQFGDTCEHHNECVAYMHEATMTCRNHKCACADGYELFDAYGKKCVRETNLKSSSDNVKSLQVFSILALIYVTAYILN